MVKIIETVRDGFQGIEKIIPTEKKIEYINALLKVGFDAVDVGSFVSEKAIPQMSDTEEVIKGLDLTETKSKLMVLVGNAKGAEKAAEFDAISQIIYPFSLSPTFLQKNIKADFETAEKTMDKIIEICEKSGKELVVYLAMGFGNPYGDPWSLAIIEEWVEKLISKGIRTIPISDITGESNPQIIREIYEFLIPKYLGVEFGFHLHAREEDWYDKLNAAYIAGCRRFDTVLNGLGGCPMTGYEMLSNLNTYDFISFLQKKTIKTELNFHALLEARVIQKQIKLAHLI